MSQNGRTDRWAVRAMEHPRVQCIMDHPAVRAVALQGPGAFAGGACVALLAAALDATWWQWLIIAAELLLGSILLPVTRRGPRRYRMRRQP